MQRKTTKKTVSCKSRACCAKTKTIKKGKTAKANAYTCNPYFKDLKAVEKKLKTCWTKLNRDTRNNANLSVIARDNDELMLLLGECNYLVNQFKSAAKSLHTQ